MQLPTAYGNAPCLVCFSVAAQEQQSRYIWQQIGCTARDLSLEPLAAQSTLCQSNLRARSNLRVGLSSHAPPLQLLEARTNATTTGGRLSPLSRPSPS